MTAKSAARKQVASAPARPDLFEMSALKGKLQEIPLVRPEVVERARNLVADPNYPSEEMLDRLSTLLALHLESQVTRHPPLP